MNYQIAIPTYKRSNCIQTLNFLKKENVPIFLITLFVADQDEYDKYYEKYSEYKIVIGIKGIRNQRNFINNYYEDNEYIISMDDDISDLINVKEIQFNQWIYEAIEFMKSKNIGLLGVSPVTNIHWTKSRKGEAFKAGRYLAVGVFQIYKVRKYYTLTLEYMEDYERSMLYLNEDGAVGRYDAVCIKTTFWKSGGCCASGRDFNTHSASAYKLVTMFPNDLFITMKKITQLSKTDLVPNVRMRRKSLMMNKD